MAQRRILVQVVTPGRRQTILDTKVGQPDAPPITTGGVGGGLTPDIGGLLTAQDLFTSQTLFTR
jgi:hypothetical protein